MRTAEINMPIDIQPGNATGLIIRAKQEAKRSAFLTPWGLAEMKRLTLAEIDEVFGGVEAATFKALRSGKIRMTRKP